MALPPAIPTANIDAYNVAVKQLSVMGVLDQLYDRLDLIGDRKAFGESLIMYFNKKGGLSPTQEDWARWLLAKAFGLADGKTDGPNANAEKVQSLDGMLLKVPKMFSVAKTQLKYPKFNVVNTEGKILTLKLAGVKSKHHGGVYVTSNHKNGTWYGTIGVDGTWHPSQFAKQIPNLYQTLLDLATDPVKMAKAYASKFGACCFCHKTLTDPVSVKHGYGPICAGHYGLPY